MAPPPWGKVHTPHFDAFAQESLVMTRAFPESLPTLPTRRAIYTGRRVYPFHGADFRLKGDFVGAPGWGPIPEEQQTLAEILQRGRLSHRPDRRRLSHVQAVQELLAWLRPVDVPARPGDGPRTLRATAHPGGDRLLAPEGDGRKRRRRGSTLSSSAS